MESAKDSPPPPPAEDDCQQTPTSSEQEEGMTGSGVAALPSDALQVENSSAEKEEMYMKLAEDFGLEEVTLDSGSVPVEEWVLLQIQQEMKSAQQADTTTRQEGQSPVEAVHSAKLEPGDPSKISLLTASGGLSIEGARSTFGGKSANVSPVHASSAAAAEKIKRPTSAPNSVKSQRNSAKESKFIDEEAAEFIREMFGSNSAEEPDFVATKAWPYMVMYGYGKPWPDENKEKGAKSEPESAKPAEIKMESKKSPDDVLTLPEDKETSCADLHFTIFGEYPETFTRRQLTNLQDHLDEFVRKNGYPFPGLRGIVSTLREVLDAPMPDSSSNISSDACADTSNISSDVDPDTSNISSDVDPDTSNISSDVDPDTSNISSDVDPDTSNISSDACADTSNISSDVDADTSNISSDACADTSNISNDVDPDTSNISSDVDADTSNISSDACADTSNISSDACADTSNISSDVDADTSNISSDACADTSNISSDACADTSNISSDACADTSNISSDVDADTSNISSDGCADTSNISSDISSNACNISSPDADSSNISSDAGTDSELTFSALTSSPSLVTSGEDHTPSLSPSLASPNIAFEDFIAMLEPAVVPASEPSGKEPLSQEVESLAGIPSLLIQAGRDSADESVKAGFAGSSVRRMLLDGGACSPPPTYTSYGSFSSSTVPPLLPVAEALMNTNSVEVDASLQHRASWGASGEGGPTRPPPTQSEYLLTVQAEAAWTQRESKDGQPQ